MNKYGESDWHLIVSMMINRTARQCRERWKNCLSIGDYSCEPFNPCEDEIILQKYRELGPKWTIIFTFFPNRSDVQIKNMWARYLKYKFNTVVHQPIIPHINQLSTIPDTVLNTSEKPFFSIDNFEPMPLSFLYPNEFETPLEVDIDTKGEPDIEIDFSIGLDDPFKSLE